MGDPFLPGWYDIGVNALRFLCGGCASARAETDRCNFIEERQQYERTDCADCGCDVTAAA